MRNGGQIFKKYGICVQSYRMVMGSRITNFAIKLKIQIDECKMLYRLIKK